MAKSAYIYDKMGIFISCACIIHCMALPVLSYILPSLTVFLEQEWIHFLLIAILIPMALFTFYSSRESTKNSLPLILGIMASFILVLAIFFHDFEVALTVIGSVTLICAHILNIKDKVRVV